MLGLRQALSAFTARTPGVVLQPIVPASGICQPQPKRVRLRTGDGERSGAYQSTGVVAKRDLDVAAASRPATPARAAADRTTKEIQAKAEDRDKARRSRLTSGTSG